MDHNPGIFSGVNFDDHNEKSDLYIGKSTIVFKDNVPSIIQRSEIIDVFVFLKNISNSGHATLNIDNLWGFDYRIFVPFVRDSLTIIGSSLTISQPLNLKHLSVEFQLSEDLTFAAQFLCKKLTVHARNMAVNGSHSVGVYGKAYLHLDGELVNVSGGQIVSDDDMMIFAKKGIIQSGVVPNSKCVLAQWINLIDFIKGHLTQSHVT